MKPKRFLKVKVFFYTLKSSWNISSVATSIPIKMNSLDFSRLWLLVYSIRILLFSLYPLTAQVWKHQLFPKIIEWVWFNRETRKDQYRNLIGWLRNASVLDLNKLAFIGKVHIIYLKEWMAEGKSGLCCKNNDMVHWDF